MNCLVETGFFKIDESCSHLAGSSFPDPFVRKMWGICWNFVSLKFFCENVGWETNLNPKLVISVEDFQSLLALGDQTISVDENSVDIKGEGHVLGKLDLRLGLILNFGSEDVERGHCGGSAESRLSLGLVGNRNRCSEGIARAATAPL